MTQQQFLDALGITSMIPTPLVMFVTMVGYIGNGVGGACLITLGMFFPAFSVTILFHAVLEKATNSTHLAPVLDGITAATIGMVLVSAMELIRNAVTDPIAAAIFTMSLTVLIHVPHKYTPPVLVAFAIMLGQNLYGPD